LFHPLFYCQNESASEERLLELRAKVIELECVLGETREKLGHVQQQNSGLESHLADTMEKLNQKQTLVSVLEKEKSQLTSALDEARLVSGCKSVNKCEQVSIERRCLVHSCHVYTVSCNSLTWIHHLFLPLKFWFIFSDLVFSFGLNNKLKILGSVEKIE